MKNGLYVSLSAQISLARRLETVAANIANANTPGYRVDGVSFETELAKAGDQNIAFVSEGAGYISRASGPLIPTGNPLDMAIQGEGWFAMQSNGQTIYTRDGRMQMNDSGGLISLTGAPILDAAGAPIQLDPSAGAPAIARDGMVSQNGRQVGAVGLYELDPAARLIRAGTSGFTTDKPAQPILNFTANSVVQGSIEGANVDPVREMTRMIEITRTFDGVTNGVTQTENSLQDAIKTLGGAA
ncbi:MAG: flagellar basal-body rod protein FlgF [Pseudomonadota bacterium]|nr:flagellar basal-body rod protein FlgF [Pseudomonadota bacterium]